ncbi:MAG TPA: protease modulator HflC [Candidatus Hydrogenedentes bacterium]|nr:protease modulator HflC [Candidatus Hydrogenedentota bacterium]
MRRLLLAVGITAAVGMIGLIIANLCMFVVHEREQIVVTRLSRPVHVIVGERPAEEFETVKTAIITVARRSTAVENADELRVSMGAGLYFKVPFADTVERFPDVLMTYDAEEESVVLADKKTLVVDNFARWRIIDPLLFRISVQSVSAANGRLDDVIYSAVREELGKNNLIEVIRTTNENVSTEPVAPVEGDPEVLESENLMRERILVGREKIMNAVTARANVRAREQFGIEVVDVRIKRADLLTENFEAVYGRMSAERSRISKGYRSEGQKQAQIIMGETDRQSQVIIANANRDAAKLRGEADAEAIRIIAETLNANPELYSFIRSLEVMGESLPVGTEIVVGADSGIFRLLKDYKP